jgi:hypothetical protein
MKLTEWAKKQERRMKKTVLADFCAAKISSQKSALNFLPANQ